MNQKIKNAWTKIEEGLGKCCLYKKAAHMLLNNQLRIVNSLYLTNEKCLHTLQYISLRTELILLPNLIRSLSRLICIRSPPETGAYIRSFLRYLFASQFIERDFSV